MNELMRERQAKLVSSSFNRLIPLVFDYDRRKGLSRQTFRLLEKSEEIWRSLPTGWLGQTQGVLSGLAVFGQTATGAAFVRAHSDSLPPDELALARRWRETPWILAAFRVQASLGASFWEIAPLGARPPFWPTRDPWDTLVLYSPSISTMSKDADHPIVTLLWKGDGCWHTYGPVFSMRGWAETDFTYLAELASVTGKTSGRLLDGVSDRVTSLAASMSRHPVPIELLIRWSEQPVIMGPEDRHRMCLAYLQTGQDENLALESWWRAWASDHGESLGVFKALNDVVEVYLGQGNAMRDPWFLYARKEGVLFLAAGGEKAYQRGRNCLEALHAFPEVPMVNVNVATWIAKDALFGRRQDLYERLSARLESRQEAETDPEVARSLASMQAIMDRLMFNHNEGRAESPAQTAQALNLDETEVREVSAHLKDVLGPPRAKRLLDLPPRALRAFHTPGVPDVQDYLTLNLEPAPELLEASPLMLAFRWMVDAMGLAGGWLPTTPSGYLSPDVVRAAWKTIADLDPQRLIQAYPTREKSWPWLMKVRRLGELAGLLQLDKRGFGLTETGKALSDRPLDRYQTLVTAVFQKRFWDEDSPREVLMLGFQRQLGLLTYALGELSRRARNKAGWIEASLLAQVFLENLPEDPDATARGEFVDAVAAELTFSVVRGPLHLLGWVEVAKGDVGPWVYNPKIRPSDLYRAVWKLG